MCLLNKRIKGKLSMNFKQEWRYKEAVLDVYDKLGLKLPNDEVWEYYHHLLQRIGE